MDRAEFIGKNLIEVENKIRASVGDNPVRWIPTKGAMITADYLANRVNVLIDESGVVTDIYYG